jgi:NAD(P) transhydrogenase
MDYDLVVVGSGPAGQKAAIQGAKLGKNIALVERHVSLGGACVNTGTIPSKTIREAILYLTGLNQRAIYGQSYRLKDAVSIEDIALRTRHVVEREREIIRDQLLRNHVAILDGCARFVDQHTLVIDGRDSAERRVTADSIVIATGSKPAHPPEIEFNGTTILDSDDIVLKLAQLPATIVIVGAGVIGIEFASMFAALGSKVTVVDAREGMLDFCDHEITEALRYHLRELNVVFRFGERVVKVEARGHGTLTSLESGKLIPGDVVSSTRRAGKAR